MCQIGLAGLLFAQRIDFQQAKQQVLCQALEKDFRTSLPYLEDQPAQAWLEDLTARLGTASIHIADRTEPWANVIPPCKLIVVSKGFLLKARSEQDIAQTIAHMLAHVEANTAFGRLIKLEGPCSHDPQEEAAAERRAGEVLTFFHPSTDSAELIAFQARHRPPPRKKPTLFR